VTSTVNRPARLAFCECGALRPRGSQACARCAYLDGEDKGKFGEIISVLRGTDGLSLKELASALGRKTTRALQTSTKLLVQRGRLRRYWTELDCFETSSSPTGKGAGNGCWVYALDGRTEDGR
jgi:hypothetical protein